MGANPLEVLLVEVAGHRLGLLADDVLELHRSVTVTPLPGAPPGVEGVVDVRGRLTPVMDLRGRLGVVGQAPRHTDHLVLVKAGPRRLALRVDRALDVVRVGEDGLTDVQALVPEAQRVLGVARLDGGLVVVHDLQTFLSRAEGMALDDALAAEGAS